MPLPGMQAISLEGTLIRSSGTMEGGLSGVKSRAQRWNQQQLEPVHEQHQKLQKEVCRREGATDHVEKA